MYGIYPEANIDTRNLFWIIIDLLKHILLPWQVQYVITIIDGTTSNGAIIIVAFNNDHNTNS